MITIDVNQLSKGERSVSNIDTLAKGIMKFISFARDSSDNLYYYDEGRYHKNGEGKIKEAYVDLLMGYDRTSDWRPNRARHIIERILATAPLLWDRPPQYRINMLNGLYDLESNTLLPHTPAHLNSVQIPIKYDPQAECPEWDKFLEDVFPVGVDLLLELVGLCMTPFMGVQKCIVLVGSGSNGKSTFLDGVQAAIGEDNICNIPLHTLTNPMEKFARGGLVGKLINIFGDLSAKKIDDAANFKPLTGGDRIQIEYKGKDPFYYVPFCKLIFSCNEVMKSDDDTVGYKRRFLNIPFTRQFQVDPKKGEELKWALKDPNELSGLFNRVKGKILDVMEEGFHISPAVAEIIDNYTPMPDSTKVWLEQTLVDDEKGLLPISAFYNYYCHNCMCVEPFTRAGLISYVKQLFPHVLVGANAKVGTKQVRCYLGIKAKGVEVQRELIHLASKIGD